jgi:hypothetical protein
MDSAPNLPTWQLEAIDAGIANPDSTTDIVTGQLNQQLNSVLIQGQNPTFQRAYIMGGGISDTDFDVGYKQVFVDNQVSVMVSHFEAPNVPVTQLPFSQAIYNSMQATQQVVDTLINPNLRAPSINEGF